MWYRWLFDWKPLFYSIARNAYANTGVSIKTNQGFQQKQSGCSSYCCWLTANAPTQWEGSSILTLMIDLCHYNHNNKKNNCRSRSNQQNVVHSTCSQCVIALTTGIRAASFRDNRNEPWSVLLETAVFFPAKMTVVINKQVSNYQPLSPTPSGNLLKVRLVWKMVQLHFPLATHSQLSHRYSSNYISHWTPRSCSRSKVS